MAHTNGLTNGDVPPEPHQLFDTILVIDFGSQYTHLITRRLRELNVYSELLPCTQKLSELTWKPKGIILSGGPYSVYAADAPHVDPEVFKLDVPILGVCYGMQEIAWHFGKNVLAGETREYGHAALQIQKHNGSQAHVDRLFEGLENDMEVWMSHGDKLSNLPEGFVTVATTTNAPFAGETGLDNGRLCGFGVRLGDDEIVRELVRFLLVDRPRHLLQQHRVHRGGDLRRHIDEALLQDKADLGRGAGSQQRWKLSERVFRSAGVALEERAELLDRGVFAVLVQVEYG
nr:gmp synthase [glutamine-hydrolyzing] [Quercus suber]